MSEKTEAPAGTGAVSKPEEYPYGRERVPIVDGDGYDTGGTLYYGAVAARYEEGTTWDGRNHISTATGSQWDHEEVVRTKRGKYYIVSSSQYQGSQSKARALDLSGVAKWLVRAGYVASQVSDDDLAGISRLSPRRSALCPDRRRVISSGAQQVVAFRPA